MSPLRLSALLAGAFVFTTSVILIGSAVQASVTSGSQLKDHSDLRAEVTLSTMPTVDWVVIQNRVLRYKTQKIEPWTQPQTPLETAHPEVQQVLSVSKFRAEPNAADCDGDNCKWVDLAKAPPSSATSDAPQ